LIVIVIGIAVYAQRRRHKRRRDRSLNMAFSRADNSNPVLEFQTIETMTVSFPSP